MKTMMKVIEKNISVNANDGVILDDQEGVQS